MEKALLYLVIACIAMIAISEVGSAFSKMMTKTECALSGKKICIINDPNAPKM